MSLDASGALAGLPATLRAELLLEFNKIVRNFREERWEPAELDVGRLTEVVYSILRGHVDGQYPPRSSKPRDMVQACRAFEQAGNQFSRSVRITVPRVLVSLYEFRNNRGVGHVGGDVDANHMDAIFLLHAAKWLMGELVRIFHDVTVVEAQEVVEALSERMFPLVFEVAGVKRVLNPNLSMRDKSLLLLYSESSPVPEADLVKWIEHSNASVYRRDVLRRLHREKLVEYDEHTRVVHLLPPGARYVEEQLEALAG